MTANDEKLVPKHYLSGYIHWDLVIATGMGYLEGNATKYISRWRKKGGLADLQKALHYVDKLQEAAALGLVVSPLHVTYEGALAIFGEVAKFSLVNGLSENEQLVIGGLALWKDEGDLGLARDAILLLMQEASVPRTDSNKHAIGQEEGA